MLSLRRTGFVLILHFWAAALAQSQPAFHDADVLRGRIPPPRLALILSGGGAKGLAHIGVLDVLDSAHIPIDLIVGTSIGASIGGYYAAGYTPKQLEHFAITTNWTDVLDLGDESHRTERVLSQKDGDNAVLSLRFTGFLHPVIPQALSTGERLTMLINSMVINAPGGVSRDFLTDMRVPFIAVATDIVKGERRIITSGDLTEALRASATLPLRFSPLSQDSAILMDGGLMSNIPSDIAQALGASTIVVSNATAKLRDREDLNTPWDVADQVISLMMQRQNAAELKLSDLVVTPDLDQTSSDDFRDIPHMIEAGRAAARAMLPALIARLHLPSQPALAPGDTLLPILSSYRVFSNFRLPDSAFEVQAFLGEPLTLREGHHGLVEAVLAAYRSNGYGLARVDSVVLHPNQARADLYVDAGVIRQVAIEGNEFVSPDVVYRELPFAANDIFRSHDADRTLRNLTGTGLFDYATLKIRYDPAWHGMTVVTRMDSTSAAAPTEHSMEPTVIVTVHPRAASVLRLGVLADNEFGAQFSTEIANENFLGSGASFSLKGGLGPQTRYAALTADAPRLFRSIATLMAQVYTGYQDVNVFNEQVPVNENKVLSAVTDVVRESRDIGVRLRGGGQVGHLGALFVEVRGERQRWFSVLDTAALNHRLQLRTLKGEIVIDTRNDAAYPHEGTLLDGYIESGLKLFGGGVSYTKIYAELEQAIPLSGLHTLIPAVQIGFADTYLPRLEDFSLGGITSFYGLNEYELRGKQMVEASLDYQIAIPHALFFPTYVSMAYDIGATWPEPEKIKLGSLQHGLGAQIGLKTPLGLARFGIGENFRFDENTAHPIDFNKPRFYFSLGANL